MNLKKCPFCGSNPEIYKSYLSVNRSDPRMLFELEWTIECHTCKYEFKDKDIFTRNSFGDFVIDHDGLYSLIDKWNNRRNINGR